MTIQSILDSASKVIALLSFSILILTVVHDWGYFWVVGLRFQSMQSPYDYLANSIEWLPYHLASGLLTVLLGFILMTIEKDPKYFWGVRSRKERRTAEKAFFALSVLTVIAAIFLSRFRISAFALLLSNAYAMLLALLVRFTGFLTWFPAARTRAARNVLLLPSLVLISFGLGANAAEDAVQSTTSVYRLDLKNSASMSVTLLRSMEKGALIWDGAVQRATLIRWDQIERISRVVGDHKREEALACSWFGFFCRNVPLLP